MVIKKVIIIMVLRIMVIKNMENQANLIIKDMTVDMIKGMIIIIIVVAKLNKEI